MHEKEWTAVITTAPREDPTIHLCVESLRVAGWEPVVVAEPSSEPTDCQTVWNDSRQGVWHNWLTSCEIALSTRAKRILTVQDDSFFHPDSRKLLDTISWPPDVGFVSLYTPKHYTLMNKRLQPVGIRRVRTKSLWGACALAWDADVLRKVVNHGIAKRWLGASPRRRVKVKGKWVRRTRKQIQSIYDKRKKEPHMIANSDTAIGKVCNAMRLGMYFVDPSAVSHIAVNSACGHGDNSGRRNAYRLADFNAPLIEQVIP